MHLARKTCLLLMTWRGTAAEKPETFARRHARLADRTDVLGDDDDDDVNAAPFP